MEKRNYLLFDMGGSHGRALVASYDGKKFDINPVHDFINVPVYAAGTLYWDILRLYTEIKNGLKLAFKDYKSIQSMGIDSWAVDFGFFDKNDKLISNPIHYRDNGRFSIEHKLYELIPKNELYKRIGSMLSPVASIYNLYYLKSINATELLNATDFLMIPSIFNYFLTGVKANEYTQASTTFLYNIDKKEWDTELIEMLGVRSNIFKEVLPAATNLGKVSKDISSEIDIPQTNVILTVSHDTASAEAGIPVEEHSKKWAFVTIGSWCTVGVETENVIAKQEAIKHVFYNEGSASGKNLLVRNIAGLWIMQQCRLRWIIEKDKDITWKDIDDSMVNVRPLQSFIDVDDPVFTMPNSNMPDLINKYIKSTNQRELETMGQISRCYYESLALKLRYVLENMQNLFNKKFEVLHIIGGGSNVEVLCQAVSNATGMDILAGPSEATAIGNFTMQLIASGEIKSISEGRRLSLDSFRLKYYTCKNKEIWDAAYEKFLKIINIRNPV